MQSAGVMKDYLIEHIDENALVELCKKESLKEGSKNPAADLVVFFLKLKNAPGKIMRILSDDSIQSDLGKINWSSYKLSNILVLFEFWSESDKHTNNYTAHEYALQLLKKLPGFKNVTDLMWNAAIVIALASSYESKGEGNLKSACEEFSFDRELIDQNQKTQIVNEKTGAICVPTDPDTIFTDGNDFPDLDTLFRALAMIPHSFWPKIFALRGIDEHFNCSFTDAEELEGKLGILGDSGNTALFATPDRDMLITFLSTLPHAERWKLVASYYYTRESFIEHIARGKGDSVFALMGECAGEQYERASICSAVEEGYRRFEETDLFDPAKQEKRPFLDKVRNNLLCASKLMDTVSFLQKLEKNEARTLINEFGYEMLLTGSKNPAADLIALLAIEDPNNYISALSDKRLETTLLNIQWSAYKLSQILSFFEKRPIVHDASTAASQLYGAISKTTISPYLYAYEILEKLPGFKTVPILMWSTACVIVETKSDQLDAACISFMEELDRFDLLDNKSAEEGVISCLGCIKPEFVFTQGDDFENIEKLIQVLNILPESFWSKIFGLPGINEHLKFSFKSMHDLNALLDTVEENKRAVFLKTPRVFEALLSGLPHAERWRIVALNEKIQEIFIDRIARGEGYKVFAVMDECAGSEAVLTKVLAATHKGYEKFDEKEGLHLPNECRRMTHFFHFIKEEKRPFPEMIQKRLGINPKAALGSKSMHG